MAMLLYYGFESQPEMAAAIVGRLLSYGYRARIEKNQVRTDAPLRQVNAAHRAITSEGLAQTASVPQA